MVARDLPLTRLCALPRNGTARSASREAMAILGKLGFMGMLVPESVWRGPEPTIVG